MQKKDENTTLEIKKTEDNAIPPADNVNAGDTERKRVNRNALISIAICAIITATFFLGFFVRGCTFGEKEFKASEIIGIINDTSIYYDGLSADDVGRLLGDALKGNDRYARYYSPAEYGKMLSESAGNYSGVGIGLTADGGIGKVYNNSPAYRAGVKEGDFLAEGVFKGETEFTSFDAKTEELCAEDPTVTRLKVISAFFGAFSVGDAIRIKVVRGEDELEFTLNIEDYIVSYVEYYDNGGAFLFSTENGEFKGRATAETNMAELPDDTAYIKLYEFEGGAAEQFGAAMDYLESRGKSKLILDLRDNGGGNVKILLEIASHLINDNGKTSVKVMDLQEKTVKTHFSTSKNNFHACLKEISVIADSNTASASECLIGALMDYGGANFGGALFSSNMLVLTDFIESRGYYSTYGKGIMQTTYQLASGGAFTLTTAEIFWPRTRVCVQDVGIKTNNPKNQVDDEFAIARAVEILHPATN